MRRRRKKKKLQCFNGFTRALYDNSLLMLVGRGLSLDDHQTQTRPTTCTLHAKREQRRIKSREEEGEEEEKKKKRARKAKAT